MMGGEKRELETVGVKDTSIRHLNMQHWALVCLGLYRRKLG
jgi:hypothetical protein